jgi:hypothetical protein
MEAMREAWTDDRLDDLANRMDRGFDGVDKDVRELRAETKSEFALLRGEMCERFDKVDERFDKVDARFERVNDRLDSIQRTIAFGAVAMSAAFLAGFGALVAAGV